MFLDIDSIGMSNQDFADYCVGNEPSENWEGCVCEREREMNGSSVLGREDC